MDTFNNYCGSTTVSSNYATTSSKSDEEVILLASDRPKKRAGRTKFKETRHPVYRGVRKRNNEKWVCEVREPNKKTRIWLGTFPTPEMAARAHDVAAIALRGRSACLNFADSLWRLPTPASLDAKDIRKAAAEAAKACEQQHSESNNGTFGENDVNMENLADEKEEQLYMDEDEEFGMPQLLTDMAEGLLLSPPAPSSSNGFEWDDMENNYSYNEAEKEEQLYMDEDEEFGMPQLLTDMAEGLLLSPPAPSSSNGFEWDDMENNYSYNEVSLWSYSA